MKFLKSFIFLFFCFSCIPVVDVFSELSSDEIDDRFYIRFFTEHYFGIPVPLHELSSNDRIGLIDCGVNKTDESIEDQYCILDLNEADIGVRGQSGVSQGEGGGNHLQVLPYK